MHRVVAAAIAAVLLGAAPRAAPRPWTMVVAPDVTVVGQQPAKTLSGIALHIEQFRAAVGSLVRGAGDPPPMPTIVYAFDDRTALEPYLPLYRGRPTSLAGYCHCGSPTNPNVITASLAAFSNSSAILFHEYTHVLTRNVASSIPLWLNEGLAEFYSSFALVDDGRRIEIGRPLEHHIRILRQKGMLPLAEVLRVEASSPLYNEDSRRSTFYGEAWALTHYLLMERGDGAAAISRYLAALTDGTAPEAAFESAFGEPVEKADVALRRYVARASLKSSTVALSDRVATGGQYTVRVVPAAEAEARLGGLQLGVQRTTEAAPRIEAAAAAAPEIAETQLELGLLRVQQERLDEAWTPLERAAALAPGDFLTQLTYGLMLLRQGVGDPDRAEPIAERARAALARAIAVNPRSPDALAWQTYADLLIDDHIEEADAAIARAVALAPARLDFQIRQAEVRLREGRPEEARAILETVAAATTDAAAAREARLLLERLNGGRTAAGRVP